MMRPLGIAAAAVIFVTASLFEGRTFRAPAATTPAVQASIARGVRFLERAQRPTGEFPVEERTASMIAWQAPPTPFGTAIILYSLHVVPGPLVRTLIDRGLSFLTLSEVPSGGWRYHEMTAAGPYIPPDADDTSVAAVALLLHGQEAKTTLETLAAYRNPQGRFFLWPHDRSLGRIDALPAEVQWTLADIDCVVNAHVLQLAAAQGTTLPSVCTWLVDVIQRDTAAQHSVFYTAPWLGYAVIKANELGATCVAPALGSLKAQLERSQRRDGSWGNLVETAMALSTATVVDVSRDCQRHAVAFLLAKQQRDGGWPRQLAYTADRRHPDTWQYGSAALTTGLVVEALSRFLHETVTRNVRP